MPVRVFTYPTLARLMAEKKLKNHTKTLSLKPDGRQEYETGEQLTDTANEGNRQSSLAIQLNLLTC